VKIDTENDSFVYKKGKLHLYCGRVDHRRKPDPDCRAVALVSIEVPGDRKSNLTIKAECPVCGDLNTADVTCNPKKQAKLPKKLLRGGDKGSWVMVKKEWRPFSEWRRKLPHERVVARHEHYGCETGCTGYRVYLIHGGDEEELDYNNFFGGREKAVEFAQKMAGKYRVDCVVVDEEWAG